MSDRHWYVVSPEVCLFAGNLYGWSPEPPEYGPEVVCVKAPTKRKAIVAGVKLMEIWPNEARGDGVNPFAGVKAEEPVCPHGFCFCEFKDCDRNGGQTDNLDYCEPCDAAIDQLEADER